MTAWRPLSERDQPADDYDALHEGVPLWLAGTLLEFVYDALRYDEPTGYIEGFDANRVRAIERRLQIPLGTGSDHTLGTRLMGALTANETKLLDAIDLTLSWNGDDRVVALHVALAEAGSAWTVGVDDANNAHLERRVDPAITAAARMVMKESDRAGQHLAAAWTAVYGRSPNPSQGYREAIRAVESAARPIVSPQNDRATLGTMLKDIANKPEKWRCSLKPSKGDAMTTVAEMVQLLWTAQLDRHGTDDESVPVTVSTDEAGAAVHLATTLVQWFAHGAIVRPA